jgi:hypothetical protein
MSVADMQHTQLSLSVKVWSTILKQAVLRQQNQFSNVIRDVRFSAVVKLRGDTKFHKYIKRQVNVTVFFFTPQAHSDIQNRTILNTFCSDRHNTLTKLNMIFIYLCNFLIICYCHYEIFNVCHVVTGFN